MRRFIVLLSVVLVLLGPSSGVFAQQPPLEKGTKVDDVTAKAVIKSAKDLIRKINKEDPTAVEGLSDAFRLEVLRTMDVQEGYAVFHSFSLVPFKVLKTYDVRQIPDGRFTLEIAYTGGFWLEHQYINERWVFVQSGEIFLLDDWRPSTKMYMPKDWTEQELSVNLSGGVLTFADGSEAVEIEATDVVLVTVIIADAPAPVELFKLHDGVEPIADLKIEDIDLIGLLHGGKTPNGFSGLEPGNYILAIGEYGASQIVPVAGSEPISVVITKPAEGTATPEGS